MTDTGYAEAAARALRALRAGVDPRGTGNPAAEISAIANAIRASGRRRRARVWFAVSTLALTSAAAGTAFVLHARDVGSLAPAVAVVAPPSFTVAGTAVPPGTTLRAGETGVALDSGDGTSVRLAPRSEAALVRSDAIRWFQLRAGALEAHVIKLAAGERFVVATPDRQVEVRGTRFTVSLVPSDAACGVGTVTRVSVDEGVVTVQGPGATIDRVAAGESWPSECRSPAAARSTIAAPSRPHARHASRRAVKPAATSVPEAPVSTLPYENDLFTQAIRAERAGELATARRLLDLLIARFPSSPLRESAEAEREKLAARGLR